MRTTMLLTHSLFCILSCQCQGQNQDAGAVWSDLLDQISMALRMHRILFIRPQDAVNLDIDKSLMKNSPSPIRFLNRGFQNKVDLLLTRESPVVDTTEMDTTELQELLFETMIGVGLVAPAVIVLETEADLTRLKMPDFQINQMVYFLFLETGTITEQYLINREVISRPLFKHSNETGRFVPIEDVTLDFVLRRSNFQGARMKVFVGHQPPYLYIGDRPGHRYFEADRTESGTDMEVIYPEQMKGIFRKLQIMMETELNFTSTYYRRLDRQWGDMHPNRTFYGMIGDVQRGELDLISASVTVKHSRAQGVKFLHPIGTETYALFIPTVGREELAWRVFTYPFSNGVWILLALFCLLGTLVIRLIYEVTNNIEAAHCKPIPVHRRLFEMVALVWAVFCSYLGGKPPDELCHHNLGTPMKMAVFCSFFLGTVVWAAYRASLTSELVDTIDRMPFNDLQSFLDSDYQMIARIGGASEHILKTAPEGTIFHGLYHKNLKSDDQAEEYFVRDVAPAIAKLWESDVKTAYYYVVETVLTFRQYECKLMAPWVSNYPKFLSMATPPDSPYFPFLQRFVLRHIEKGTVSVLSKRWKYHFPQCETSDGEALTAEKTVSLFAVWAAGAAAAVAIMVTEAAVACAKARNLGNQDFGKTERGGRRRKSKQEELTSRVRALARQLEDEEVIDKKLFMVGLEELIEALKQSSRK